MSKTKHSKVAYRMATKVWGWDHERAMELAVRVAESLAARKAKAKRG